MAVAILTLGAYAAVSAVTNDGGRSDSRSLTRSGISPWRDRFAPLFTAPEPSPGVARTEVATIVPVTPTPAPTEPPTPVPVPPTEVPTEVRVPAAQAEPELPPPAPPPPPPAAGFRYELAGSIAALFNDVRAQNGVRGVANNGSLSGAAAAYAEYHYLNYGPLALSHSYDGTPGERADRNGYWWSNIGEVIAGGGNSAPAFIDLWMDSSGHRDIILDGVYVDVGVGCYESPDQAILCVALFGAPY